MPGPRRNTSTSYSISGSTSYPTCSYQEYTTTTSRPRTGRSAGRPTTARPRTGASTIARIESQEIVCAVAESRGVSPTVGLAFVNLDTGEAALSQINDSQTYVRTLNKLMVYGPSQILIPNTAADPPSTLYLLIVENELNIGWRIGLLDRRYYAETTGLEYIRQLAFAPDVEAISTAIGSNYWAICCFAAALKYIEFQLQKTFKPHTLRIAYYPPEGSMMIDVSTIHSLELIQNIQHEKSKACLFGLLHETLTPMGARILRSNILQPSTMRSTLMKRYDAVEELAVKEQMFFATRQALKGFLDVEKILSRLIVEPKNPTIAHKEQAINHVIMLKHFVNAIPPVCEALAGAASELLRQVLDHCQPDNINPIRDLIDSVINEDIMYAKSPLELRNQRTYAIKSGVNGLLDVARQTFKEASEDAYHHVEELGISHGLRLELKFDTARQFHIRLPASDLEDRTLPQIFTNAVKRKNMIECQTLELMKTNQKIADAHIEVLGMSDEAVQQLIEAIREKMVILYKCCDSIALLDMLTAFAHIATSQDYIRPEITDTLAIQAGRHAIKEKFNREKFVPNDVYAAQQSRFQIITGCNMSGKSTYIRSIAIVVVMAQIGSFVPASYASFPITHQLFARVNTDDSIEANMSTFAAEMRETAFILKNVDKSSIAIIDELGRGTSTRDGLAIAIAIAEALVNSRALVWFATHFRDLATIMGERSGVVNYHLKVELGGHEDPNAMKMLYRVAEGAVREKHYGLALAQVVPLPQRVLEVAQEVAHSLDRNATRKKKTSVAVVKEKRRKLLLTLKEHLVQAHQGMMEGKVLADWLKQLQKDFIRRMMALDVEAAEAQENEDNETPGNVEQEISLAGDVEMGEESVESETEV